MLGARDVERLDGDATTLCFELGGKGLQAVSPAGVEHDRVAETRQVASRRLTNPAARASNHDDFLLPILHDCSPLIWWARWPLP